MNFAQTRFCILTNRIRLVYQDNPYVQDTQPVPAPDCAERRLLRPRQGSYHR